ncbi:MAG: hypothetical protein QOI76_1422 [Frankiales bacterium]|jgi:hypothetical protein|nr:hypothetical protein [Frankiales bacterium]
MAWTWRYENSGAAETGRSEEFPTQGDAESWIGETWRELAADGVDAVTLFEDDRDVYGPMSLSPAG